MSCCAIYTRPCPGQKLLHGHGVPLDEAAAMAWFKAASAGGHPEASYNLAIGHLNGADTGLEEGEHEQLLRHALRHGVEAAEAALDHVCCAGRGTASGTMTTF